MGEADWRIEVDLRHYWVLEFGPQADTAVVDASPGLLDGWALLTAIMRCHSISEYPTIRLGFVAHIRARGSRNIPRAGRRMWTSTCQHKP